jgi:hypothetical protein
VGTLKQQTYQLRKLTMKFKLLASFLILSVNKALLAAPCNGINDTDNIKALINSTASVVQLPSETCVIKGSIFVPGGKTIRGVAGGGTVLVQAASAGPSERMFYTNGDGIIFEQLVLDGNRSQQSVDEHRAGIFVRHAGTVIRNVHSHHFTGDGFYLYNGAVNTQITNVEAHDNDRDGIALTGAVGAMISNSQFYNNDADDVDVEPGVGQKVSNLIFDRIVVGGTGSKLPGNVVIGGRPFNETGRQGDNILLSNSNITGWVRVVYTHGAIVRNNTIVNPLNKPAIEVYGYNANAQVYGNTVTELANTSTRPIGIAVTGTGTVDSSFGTSVINNRVSNANALGFGIYVTGVRDITIIGNRLQGAGVSSTFGSGIFLRATLPAQPFKTALVTSNTITDFGAYGLSVWGNGTAALNSALIQGNTFSNSVALGSQTIAIKLNDSTNALKSAICGGNITGQGVAQKVTNVPPEVVCNF